MLAGTADSSKAPLGKDTLPNSLKLLFEFGSLLRRIEGFSFLRLFFFFFFLAAPVAYGSFWAKD